MANNSALCANMVIASIVHETLTKFLYSPDKGIQTKHMACDCGRLIKILNQDGNTVSQIMIQQVQKLWKKMIDISDETIPMVHAGYLKLFQL
jgi:hypothetical protein